MLTSGQDYITKTGVDMAKSKIKIKEIELKRQIILEEATKLIDKVGFKNAKMEDIAKKVGFSKASLYSYFKYKEEIAISISKEHLVKLYNKISDLPSKDIPASDKLGILKNAHLDFMKRSKNFMVIKLNYAIVQKAHEEFIDLKLKLVEILKLTLEQGKKEGIFNKSLDSNLTSYLLEAVFTGIAFTNSLVRSIKSDKLTVFNVDEMVSFAMDFFYMGITNTKTEKCK